MPSLSGRAEALWRVSAQSTSSTHSTRNRRYTINVPTATHDARGTYPPLGGHLRSPVRAGAVAGMIAGPFFLVASALQMPLYDEFDLTKHPFSFLSIGEHGWLQQVTFVVTGCLFILCAPAFVRGLGGRAGRWGGALATLLGAGKIVAGIFVVDPAFGFPAGTPAGPPEHVSASSSAHGLGFAVSMVAWVVLLFMAGRRLNARGHHRLAWITYGVALALLTVPPFLMATSFGAVVLYVVLPTAYLVTTAVVRKLVVSPASSFGRS